MKRKAEEELERPDSKAPRRGKPDQQDHDFQNREIANGRETAVNETQNVDSHAGQRTVKPALPPERSGTKRKASKELGKADSKAPRILEERNDTDVQISQEQEEGVASDRLEAEPATSEVLGVDSARSQNNFTPNDNNHAEEEPTNDTVEQDSTHRHATASNDGQVHTGADRGEKKIQDGERPNAKTEGEVSIELDSEQQEKYKKDMDNAFELLTQLSMLLETHRYDKATKTNAEPSQRQEAQLAKVCELACQPGMATSYYLKGLSMNFFSETQRLQAQRQRTKQLEKEHCDSVGEFTRLAKVFDTAVSKRTAILLSAPDAETWSETANKQERVAAKARERMDKSEKTCTRVQEDIGKSQQAERAIGKFSLFYAESGLIELKLLQPPQVSSLREDGEPAPEVEKPQHDGQDRSEPERSQHQTSLPPEEGRDHITGTIGEIARHKKRQQLREAADKRSIASKERVAFRDHYNHDFARFLNAQKDGAAVDTRSEWDHYRLMENNKFNLELNIAEMRYEFAKREAKQTGVIRRWEQTSNFDDWTDDGYDDDSQREDLIWDLKKEDVEK